MFDHFLESSRQDDYNKWSNIGFGQELGIIEMKIRALSGALTNTLLIWSPVQTHTSIDYFCHTSGSIAQHTSLNFQQPCITGKKRPLFIASTFHFVVPLPLNFEDLITFANSLDLDEIP